MQTAGNFVGIAVKFAACMQLGHDNLSRRNTFFFVDINRNSATIVRDRNAVVSINFDAHMVSMTGQRLINSVVDNLIHHMMQPAAIIGVANVHSRTFSNGL